jgi:5-methylthioadenosine/S-adenosylhomocysteine deaminase
MNSPAPTPLDLLLLNADILSAEPAESSTPALIRGGCIGIAGGLIRFVSSAPPAGVTAARTLDLAGRLITPGFINIHLHSALTMVRGVAADLGFAPSYTRGIPNAMDLSPEEATALARLGALEAMLSGSTLIGEHFVHADHALPALAELGIRVHSSLRLHDVDFAAVANGAWNYEPEIGSTLLEANLRLYDTWHGQANGRVAVQFAAHAADTCSPPFLRQIAAEAQRRGAVVNTHLAQSKTEIKRVKEETGRTPVQVFDEAGLLNDKLLCGHCLYVNEGDLPRFAASGAHVVHIPKCNAASGRMAPVHKLKDAGMNITLATDTQHGDMIELLRWALATGRVQEGGVSERWQPRDVFAMGTLNGAIALGLENELGSLAAGKRADLVVLDCRRAHLTPLTDPLGNLVHTAQGRDVEMVIVDGAVVVEDGHATQVDERAIIGEARAVAQSLWQRARAAA